LKRRTPASRKHHWELWRQHLIHRSSHRSTIACIISDGTSALLPIPQSQA
jgi:hypothetical protein